jgi:hypothetical protein
MKSSMVHRAQFVITSDVDGVLRQGFERHCWSSKGAATSSHVHGAVVA